MKSLPEKEELVGAVKALIILVPITLVGVLKYHDVRVVRRVVPDLGFVESFFWPIDEPRDEIMICPSPKNPDEDTRRWVQKWVDDHRTGNVSEYAR